MKRINLQNETLTDKYTKIWTPTKRCKNRWIFFQLAEWVDGFILKLALFIPNFLSSKRYEIQQMISPSAKMGI